jgi:hypothetical protein
LSEETFKKLFTILEDHVLYLEIIKHCILVKQQIFSFLLNFQTKM